MNPVKVTLTFFVLFLLWMFYMPSIGSSDKDFEVIMYSYHLAPFVCLLLFVASSLFYRKWIKENKIATMITAFFIITWIGYVVYIRYF